jgi:hypothetical protein
MDRDRAGLLTGVAPHLAGGVGESLSLKDLNVWPFGQRYS